MRPRKDLPMQALNMPHQNSWYVQVNGQVYGPYSDEQMQGFCVEGRVNAYSILSQSPHNGFTQATQFQSFLNWSGRLQPQHQMGAVSCSAKPCCPRSQSSSKSDPSSRIPAPSRGVGTANGCPCSSELYCA